MRTHSSQFSDELKAAFGGYIIEWAAFEDQMGMLFSEVLGGNAQRALVIFNTQGGFKGKRDMLYAVIADTAFTQPSDELVKILTEADELATRRNDLAHGFWHWRVDEDEAGTKTEAVVAIYKPRSRSRSYMFSVGAKQLKAWTAEIAALIVRLQELDPKSLTRRREHRKKNPRN